MAAKSTKKMNADNTTSVSSDDSNIMTVFQSFDRSNFIISPSRDLSQTFAQIVLLIGEGIDYDDEEAANVSLNKIYNLLLNLIYIIDCHTKLISDFVGFFESRINEVMAIIFSKDLFRIIYSLKPENIDLIWHIHRILGIVYPFGHLKEEGNGGFLISDEVTINIIRSLQLPLFKYLRTDNDEIIYTSLKGNSAMPCNFFRGDIKLNVIVIEKLKLIKDSLATVLKYCTVSSNVVNYFKHILDNIPIYFSFELYSKQVSIIQERAVENPVLVGIQHSLNKIALKSPIASIHPLQASHLATVIKNTFQADSLKENNYKFYVDDCKRSKVPKWVDIFNDKERSTVATDPSLNQSLTVMEPSIPVAISRGFRQRFKHALGLDLVK